MTARERLPNRRTSTAFEIELNGLRFTASVSRFADGRIAEIFLQNHKPGSQSDANARDAAVAASLALQFGCPLQVLQRAVLRDSQSGTSTPLGKAIDIIAQEELGRHLQPTCSRTQPTQRHRDSGKPPRSWRRSRREIKGDRISKEKTR
jgi:ribonucleoside-diphosphate reductase alpha chain